MTILYICDRCGDCTKDRSNIRTVSLCTDSTECSDIAARSRIGAVESIRMLCPNCIGQVQATICEQLPQGSK
jgi:coenzyme F420-reducing hydrogenase delta subunit